MNTMNIPAMPVSIVVDELTELYVKAIESKAPFELFPTPFLWGPPGVGKSDGVKELAENLEAVTGKKVVVTDIRLLLFSPIDLRGVPVADESRKFTDWLKPRILDLDASKDVVNILFLDELSAAPQSVQAAAYQLTLNRAIGEHRLPDNTIVIAAGNRTSDRSVAYRMPSALANRLMHFEVSVDFDSWADWAVTKGNVHPLVLGYLSYDMDKLHSEEINLDEVAFRTPRSWMFVSNILNACDDVQSLDRYHSLIGACIGAGASVEFIAWCKIYDTLPKIEEIFDGTAVAKFTSPDSISAISAVITTNAIRRENQGKFASLTYEEVDNMCSYVNAFPMDFAACLYERLLMVDSLQLKLMKSKAFREWGKKNTRTLAAMGISLA